MSGLIDSTLREGEQTVGVHFSAAQKSEICPLLCRVGIEEIELGVATRLDPGLPGLVQACRRLPVRIALWARCRPDDIDFAASLRPDVLSLSIPVSELHLRKKLGRDREWALAAVRDGVRQARTLGIPFVSLGLEDATRAEPDFVDKVVAVAAAAGANRIRIADTVGVANPLEISALVRRVQDLVPLAIGVHTHNDFGMASANAIAALEAGAQWADVTVLGLGERAGNARLEELTAYLTVRRGRSYRLEALAPLSSLVARAAGRAVAPQQPVVGADIFACETGLHLQGLEQDPATYEPYPPETVGSHRRLLYGSKIGRRAVRAQLAALGPPLSESQLEETVRAVRQQTREQGRPFHYTLRDFTAQPLPRP